MTPARTAQNAGDAQNARNAGLQRADIQDPGLQCSCPRGPGLPGSGRESAARCGRHRREAGYRGLAALGAIALGIGGAFATPVAASAAPAPCEQAQRYAAQSGAQLFRLNKLDAGNLTIDNDRRGRAGAEAKSRNTNNKAHDAATSDVGVAEAKSALVAGATINAAAVTRLLDADGERRLSKPVIQQAPPTRAKAAIQKFPEGTAGPIALGRGTLTSRAKWDPRMACGAASGDVTRAEATVAGGGIGALVRVPAKARSLSTTALEPGARTVAFAGLTLGSLDLLDGAVRVKIVRQPQLTAQMSTKDGGKISYAPPVLQVSGDDIETRRLDTAGDVVELALSDGDGDEAEAEGTDRKADAAPDDSRRAAESNAASKTGSDAATGSKPSGVAAASKSRPGAAGNASDHLGAAPPPPQPRVEPAARNAGALDGLLSGLPKLGALTGGSPLPLPTAPGLPQVGGSTESAPVTGPGTRMRISLGDLRQAKSGRAIAAKATAIKIAITEAPTDGQDGYGGSAPDRSRAVLDLDVGLLEAAAVAPEPTGGVHGAIATNGGGGGLPITGPGASPIAVGGLTLLLAGVAALTVGRRRHRFRP
jgi:hypothetical protein